MKKSKSLIFTTLLAFAMVFTMMFATMPNNVKSVYASSTQKSIGFAIKERFDVYFAETGNNKVQNTSTGVDGKLTHLPELYRTDTLDYTFDGWYIANTDTKVTIDTVYNEDVTLVDRWTYSAFDSNYKVSTITINNTALNYGTKQGEYSASAATANVDGITATSGTTFTIYKGLNKSGDALVGDEEVELGKNYSVATTITLKDGYKFDDQIHFYAENGLAANYKFKGNFWTTNWSTDATQVEVIINFVQSDEYHFTQQPESREFENYTEYHYYYTLNEEDEMEELQGVQLQYYDNESWTLFGPATMVVSPYANRTITFRLAASYEHGTIYSEPWTITWRVINQSIDEIALGIDTPRNGNAPSYLTSIPDSRFKIAITNDTYTQNGIKWTGSVSGDLEVGNATFNNDEDYTVSYKLVAQEGYSFDVANMGATINTNNAIVTGNSEEITISYTFEKAAPTTYSVFFNPSLNGTGTMDTVVVKEGDEYELPNCSFTPNTNYEFAAWSVSGELKKPGDVIIVNSNQYIFAVWQASSTPVSEGFTIQPTGGTTVAGSYFTVNFEVDENINYDNISILEYNEQTGTWDGFVNVRDNIPLTIGGKIKQYGFYVEDVSNKILRLYAYREGVNVAKSDTFTVNFTPAEFTKQPQGTTIVNGSTHTFTWATTFDARFRILYWDTEYNDWSNGGETTGHSFSVTKNTTQAITYKVVADIPYTMANGATNYVWDVAASQSFIVSWVEDVPEATGITATYTGTILAGTTINPSGIQITMDYSNAPSTPVNAGAVEYWYNGTQITNPTTYVFGVELIGNLNITIKYEGLETTMAVQIVGHAITFNVNGGTGTMSATEYVGNYTLPSCTFTAPTGKQFAGWSTSDNGNVIEGTTINIIADTELFAIWEDIPQTPTNPENPQPPVNPEQPEDTNNGLGAGAIVGIVLGSILVLGTGGFALVWFVIKKKSWADFIAIFKKK